MRATYQELAEYLGTVAGLLERYGVVLRTPIDEALTLLEDAEGRLSFELVGDLPEGPGAARSEIAVRELFLPIGFDLYDRHLYEYELIDYARDYRRAFHLHFPSWFEQKFLVVVHEHCERPVGHAACEHYEGSPIRDAYAGVRVLMDTWTGPTPDCSQLRCLG